MRGFTWIDEEIEHSDREIARATALAAKWSELHRADEQRGFAAQARREDEEMGGYYRDPYEDLDDAEAGEARAEDRQAELNLEAERELEIEMIEEKLEAIGARMMRPYEHWNEDERYVEYAESDR